MWRAERTSTGSGAGARAAAGTSAVPGLWAGIGSRRGSGRDGTSDTGCIGDIRITGAMSAIEIVDDDDADRPNPDLTKAIAAEAANRGVILLTCGVRGNVIRFLPPLTIGESLMGEALKIVGDVVRKLAGQIRKAS